MKDTILGLRDKLNKQNAELNKYYDYYKGDHKILTEYKKSSMGNHKEIINFCKLFIEDNVGFLLGNNVRLKYKGTGEEDTLIDYYNRSYSNIMQQHNQRLMQTQQIFGYTYEINYVNSNGEMAMSIVTPLQMSINRKGKKVLEGLLFKHELEDVRYYDYFDVKDNKIYEVTIEDDLVSVKGSKYNIINNPIIVVYNNWEKQSEIKDIMLLNDSYNQISSDLTNEISDHRNAYLHISGGKITDEVLSKMKESGIITSPDSIEVGYLVKDINDTFVQNKLEQLETQIYNMASQVNFNDTNIGSNTSSLALRNKLVKLMNSLKLKEGFIREAHNIRLKNYSEYLKSIMGDTLDDEVIDPTQVDMTFVLNIPTSDVETANMVIGLYSNGLISKESAIGELSMIDDARAEMLKIDVEREEQEDSNLKRMYQDTLSNSIIKEDAYDE